MSKISVFLLLPFSFYNFSNYRSKDGTLNWEQKIQNLTGSTKTTGFFCIFIAPSFMHHSNFVNLHRFNSTIHFKVGLLYGSPYG